jgi:hypothetical protein
MLGKKATILFVMLGAIFVLFAYKNAKAADCIELKGFKICTADPFYQKDSDSDVSFNYTVEKVSSQRLLSFIDILIPGNIDVGSCRRVLGENVNCSNVETKFGNSSVTNVVYYLKEGTPISSFGKGISDKRALRAIIAKNLGSAAVPFSVKFKNQTSASLPKSGLAYVQVTRPFNQYDSAKYPGPDEVTTENFGQPVFKIVKIPGTPFEFHVDTRENRVYKYNADDARLELLEGQLISSMFISFTDQSGTRVRLPAKNFTEALLHIGEDSCYPYCFKGRYYTICSP